LNSPQHILPPKLGQPNYNTQDWLILHNVRYMYAGDCRPTLCRRTTLPGVSRLRGRVLFSAPPTVSGILHLLCDLEWCLHKWCYLQNRRAGLLDKKLPSDSYNTKHLPAFYNMKAPFYFAQRPAKRLQCRFWHCIPLAVVCC